MPEDVKDLLQNFKELLLSLPATGEHGFEGLMAGALSNIAGQPFRLASSGSQHGRDGESSFDSGALRFEAKLYSGPLKKDAVVARITETGVGTDQSNVDVWVLASTEAVSAQLATLCRLTAERLGLGLLLLDWSELTLPPLALALAVGSDGTREFFAAHQLNAHLPAVSGILEAIRHDDRYRGQADKLRNQICSPAIGIASAATSSGEWLRGAFSDVRRARVDLGQPLAPLDSSLLHVVDRPTLVAEMRVAFEEPGVLAVLGDEGTGKSWLLAQAWLAMAQRPILVFLPSDALSGVPSTNRFEEILRRRLIHQAAEGDVDSADKRWRRRFDHWRTIADQDGPRLVVALDGLNQAADTYWPRWVDAASIVLENLGGSLVVTSRLHYFDHFVREDLICSFVEVKVPTWSVAEVRVVLQANSIDPSRIPDSLCESLRNPRLLGLAVHLLNASEVEELADLSYDRLLFEYMRRYPTIGGSRVTRVRFARTLRGLAQDVMDRLLLDVGGHPLLATSNLENELGAVAQTQFFKPLPGDPTAYELTPTGLPVALALSIVHALRLEERAGRDPAEALDRIVEPILALDRTADVMGAAVMVAALDPETSTRVRATLVRSFIGLQNVPHHHRSSFMAMASDAPRAFIEAAREVCTSTRRVPNMDWLTDAVASASKSEDAWPTIAEGVREWLSTHSLAPGVRVRKMRGHHSDEEVDEEMRAATLELRDRVDNLSVPEAELLHGLQRMDGTKLDQLHLLALSLLAGKPLVPFADALVGWAFSNALNSGIHSPSQAFRDLIRFNTCDWLRAREALRTASADFNGPDTSRVGRWALVAVLRATGGLDEAEEATDLVAELKKDDQPPLFSSWRLVENYCASDPCDPSSEEPENISETAARYRETDVSKLRIAMAQTSEDMFFRMARPGLVRFRRDVAVDVHRTFCEDVGLRGGVPRRLGAFGVLQHSALLQHRTTDRLVESALRDYEADHGGDEWIASQYLLWAAFPHLDGDRQLSILAQVPGRSLLLSLMESTTPASVQSVERCLKDALEADDDTLARVLTFVASNGATIPDDLIEHLVRLAEYSDPMIRAQSLRILVGTGNSDALAEAVRQWHADDQNPDENRQEKWFGSAALARAVELRVLNSAEAIERMSPMYYGVAVRQLGSDAAQLVAPRIDAAIRKATASPDPPPTLRISRNLEGGSHLGPTYFHVSEDIEEPEDLRAALELMSETPEGFRERQDRVHEKFKEFWQSLTSAGGRVVLEPLSFEEVRHLLDAEPAYLTEWLDLLLGLDACALGKIHWVGTFVAEVAARRHPTKAIELIRQLEQSPELVHFSRGLGAASAERVSVWRTALVIPGVQEMCFHRFDRAQNDEAIAEEVLSASIAGAGELVRSYVDRRLAMDEPAWKARALMATGFSGESAHATEVLSRFARASGFLGSVHEAAVYAYDRNAWARHWFEEMIEATAPEDVWAYATLMAKIIDARCELWWSPPDRETRLFEKFLPTFRQECQRRIKKWREKRRKTLFGQTVSDPVFVPTQILLGKDASAAEP